MNTGLLDMLDADRLILQEKLVERFPGQFVGLAEPWEQSEWSKIYRVEFLSGDARYLKGTPRSRLEGPITSRLHRYCPDLIPAVLDEDLLPGHRWRWFLLEHAGECSHAGISPECAAHAAYHLSRLQKTVCGDAWLAQSLPQCRADGLGEVLSKVCEWALQTASPGVRDELISLQARLARSTGFFLEQRSRLAHFPSTCVHGDFWSGNIACREDGVSFIDWGDTLWGVGSISVDNLLASAGGELSARAGEIWEAYARGWGKDITADFIQASRIAALVGSLLVDVEIAQCCGWGVNMLPHLIPGLQQLADLSA